MLDSGLHTSSDDGSEPDQQSMCVVDKTPEGMPIYGMKNGVDNQLSTLKQEGAAFIDTEVGEKILTKRSC